VLGILCDLGLVEPSDEFAVKDIVADVGCRRFSIAECT